MKKGHHKCIKRQPRILCLINIFVTILFFLANKRAVIAETEAAGPFKNISLTGYDIYNFYDNQVVEIFPLLDSKFVFLNFAGFAASNSNRDIQ